MQLLLVEATSQLAHLLEALVKIPYPFSYCAVLITVIFSFCSCLPSCLLHQVHAHSLSLHTLVSEFDVGDVMNFHYLLLSLSLTFRKYRLVRAGLVFVCLFLFVLCCSLFFVCCFLFFLKGGEKKDFGNYFLFLAFPTYV